VDAIEKSSAASPPSAARAGALDRPRCRRWWWHAPRSRCIGVRQGRFRHARLRMAIGTGVMVLLVGLAVLRHTGTGNLVVEAVSSSHLGWLAIAVALQAGSMGTFARLQQRVLANAGLRLPLSSSLAIAFAGNAVSVTVPVAGTTASAAFTYRQYVRRGASGTMAGWAMAVAGVFSTTTFALLIGVGALANGNPIAAAAGITSIALAVMPVIVIVAAVRSLSVRRRMERVAIGALTIIKRLTRRPRKDPSVVVVDAIAQLSAYRLRWREAVVSITFATLNWVFDAVCLWAVLQAFDVSMPLRNLALVYSAAVAAASLSLTPAGIGTVEASIAVALTGLGTDGVHALPAAVAYRAISTWLVLLIGWVVLAAMRRKSTDEIVADELRTELVGQSDSYVWSTDSAAEAA
jgi:uncharacterized protein (TIRG00374 family)